MPSYSVAFVDSITEIGQESWNALAGTDNPFTCYEFLHALESSGCTTRETGWQPCHLVIRAVEPGLDEIAAIMPLYLKSNSWGEYVFDWSWANAYESHGLSYYPKFVSSAPFTPSYGKRLFVRESDDVAAIMTLIKNAIAEKADYLGASSWHVLFPNAEQHAQFTAAGLLSRQACQFQWFNRDYASFDEFLSTLSSRKRKNIRKERQRVAAAGVQFEIVEGSDIDATLWQDFHAFYQSTYLIRGMRGYLNEAFFRELSRTMPDKLFLLCARQQGELIAGALFFRSSDTLFGRYWGSAKDYQFLHFETCYYQGQDYAIANKIRRFDSGAQGEHKIQRGFEPVTTYSNHWIANAGFREAIANFLRDEDSYIERYREQAETLLPYRQSVRQSDGQRAASSRVASGLSPESSPKTDPNPEQDSTA